MSNVVWNAVQRVNQLKGLREDTYKIIGEDAFLSLSSTEKQAFHQYLTMNGKKDSLQMTSTLTTRPWLPGAEK